MHACTYCLAVLGHFGFQASDLLLVQSVLGVRSFQQLGELLHTASFVDTCLVLDTLGSVTELQKR